jgi:N-acetylgalactosamine-N,N'-diacetylbacillosaminyl-diphospho-undecaprenol 4-alpha-N-acetylgalactosaminyltransferase
MSQEAAMPLPARPRAFFVINSLEGGGAERVFATLIAGLASQFSCSIELVLLDRYPEKYEVPGSVRRHQLDCGQRIGASISGLYRLVARERPDLIFSFLTRANCAAIIAGKRFGIPVVVSERVNTSSHFARGLGGLVNRMAVRVLYPLASRVVAPSHGVANDLILNYNVASHHVDVIHNPVDRAAIASAAARSPDLDLPSRYWLGIGRLVPNKNFAMMLDAFAAAGARGDLVILGEGPERAALEARARQLGIAKRVRLAGFSANPFPSLARARAYLSTSNAEGFPNALVEALALGVPVAATDCDSGPGEILSGHNRDKVTACTREAFGMLVPVGDVAAMAAAIRQLDEDDGERDALAAAAARRGADFDIARAVDRFRAVLEEAVAPSLTSR